MRESPPIAQMTSSGVRQPTEFQVRIIFADGGWIPQRVAQDLIKDDRMPLETKDLLDNATLFECSIIIGSNLPVHEPACDSHIRCRKAETEGKYSTSWHIWYHDEHWTIKHFKIVPMNDEHPRLRHRKCAMIHLCHQKGDIGVP